MLQAELLLFKCNLDLLQLKEAADGTELCFEERPESTNGINFECQMLTKGKTNRMLSAMHPQMKQTLLDCLRKNFHVSGNDYNSKAWYTTYLESLFLMPGSFRRKLSSRWHRSAKEVSKSSDLEHTSIKLSSTSSQKEKKSDHQQTIIIAVVVTATVTFIIVALLFICYNSISSRMKQNDENHARPLLSLSISEYYSILCSYKLVLKLYFSLS